MPDATAIERAVRGLFDVPVGLGLTDPSAPQPAVWAGEAEALAGAVPARRNEFAAGRAAARMAMQDAGCPAQAVPVQANRAPDWPQGLAGSITHTRQLCLAVVSNRAKSLGLDAEQLHRLDEDIIPIICSDVEISRHSGIPLAELGLMIFAAKEAAYKAQFPLTGQLFGFEVLDVTLDPPAGRFDARFLHPIGPFSVGDSLPGRFAEVAGHLVTGVAIGQRDGKGA